MTIPRYQNIFNLLTSARRTSVVSYITVEGIPFAFGTQSIANWTGVTDVRQLRDSVLNCLHSKPMGFSQQLDTMNGGNINASSMTFKLLDANNAITALCNTGTPTRKLTTALNAGATTINMDSTAGLVTGSYIYIGLETIKVGTVASGTQLTGCTRGMFGSKSLVPVSNSYGIGFPVGLYPYTMAGRRMWYWNNFYDGTNGASYSPTGDSLNNGTVLRFAGVIRQFSLDEDRNLYVLRADSIDKELDRPLFTNIRSFSLRYSQTIMDGQGNDGILTAPGWPGDIAPNSDSPSLFNTIVPDFGTISGPALVADAYYLFKIDEEIFALQWKVTGGGSRFLIVARALYGTKAAKHDTSAQANELVPVVQQDINSADWAAKCSQFRIVGGQPTIQADHPIALILQVLLSVYGNQSSNGIGNNTENYDVLPYGWGLAIDRDRVDVAGMLAAASEDPALRWTGFITEAVNNVDFMKDMLTFCGYYFTTITGGILTVKKLRYPMPDETVFSVNQNRIIASGAPSWDANFGGAIRRLDFQYTYDYTASKYRNVTVFLNNNADIYSRGMAKAVTYQSKFIHKSNSGVPQGNLYVPFDVDTWLLSRADYIKSRYGKPPPIVKVTVDYAFIAAEVGMLVTLTDPNTPNHTDGTRGVAGLVGEIIGKEEQDDSRTVVLTLAMTPQQISNYRYFDISARIDSTTTSDAAFGGPANVASPDLYVDATGAHMAMGVPAIYVAWHPFMRFLPQALRGNTLGQGDYLEWMTASATSHYALGGVGNAMFGFYSAYEFEVKILTSKFEDVGDYMVMQNVETTFAQGNAMRFVPSIDSNIASFAPMTPANWVGRYLVARIQEANWSRIPDFSPIGTMTQKAAYPNLYDLLFPG